MFEASDVALQFVASVRPVVEMVADRDANLADQLRRAVTSAALNTAEAGRREGRDRHHRARIAAAEAQEVKAALEIAAAWGALTDADLVDARALADRVGRITYALAR